MPQVTDLRIGEYIPLVAPRTVKQELLMTDAGSIGRVGIERILRGEDKRLLVIVGPCSIHDENSASNTRSD